MNFSEKCYNLLKKVPRGKVVTYKQIAKKLGSKGYRGVGNAMNRNKDKKISCHRVICSNGKIGEFNRGISSKIKLLRKEGIRIDKRGRIDLKKYGYFFR